MIRGGTKRPRDGLGEGEGEEKEHTRTVSTARYARRTETNGG
jgi:hypothetical protein